MAAITARPTVIGSNLRSRAFTRRLLLALQDGDEVQLIQAPADEQTREQRRDQDDGRRKRVCRILDDKRNPVKVGVERSAGKPGKSESENQAERDGHDSQDSQFA